MTPDRWARVKEVFHAALERGVEERMAFVARVCDADEALRGEVERLLAAHAQAGGFIEPSPAEGQRQSLTGHAVGRYHVGRLIGTGGMGEVYAARDGELGREVALKIGIAAADGFRLRREAQRAALLNHPHICTIHEVGVFEGQPYIVMEYVQGQRLSELIPPGGQEGESVVRYGIQIADALAHAHQHGVIHRDLKSMNVVVTPEGRAKVLDFGIASLVSAERLEDLSKSHEPVTAQGSLVGTLAYMAPELLRGEHANERSDIWALGVLLYELASGARPFRGTTGFELSAAILYEAAAPLPARIPAPLQQIIRRCLSKDPRERYKRADEVRAALEAVESAPNMPRAWLARSVQRVLDSRRNRAALVGLAALIAVATLTWRTGRSPSVGVAVGAGGRPSVAVMPFDNLGSGQDTAWLSKGVPTMLLAGLAQTQGLEIVGVQRLQDVITQMGAGSLETLGRNEIAEVAQRAGAGAIVVGGISKAGSEIRIDAQLEDLASGRVLVAETVRGTDLFVLVDQLAARIRDGIGFSDAAGIRKVSDVSTSSLEAFRLYSQAEDALINTRMDDAEKLLERAVAIDPGFADAYLHLVTASSFRGLVGLQREYLRKAAEHAGRLGERQRLILEAGSARVAGDSATVARAVDELIERFPDEHQAYGIASQLYAPVTGLVHDPGKWLRTAAAGAAALPTSMATHNLYAYALLGAGRYEEALGEFNAYARLAPREPNPFDSFGEAYLVMGAPDRALESYSRALTIDPTFAGSRIGRAWSLASLGRYDEAIVEEPPRSLLASWSPVKALVLSRVGRYREADRTIEAGRRESEIHQNPEEQGYAFLVSSLMAIEQRMYGRALQDARSAEGLFASLPEQKKRLSLVVVHLISGIAEARAGRLDEARVHLRAQARLFNASVEPENWWNRALEGEIALAAGDVETAASAFAAGKPSNKMWFSTRDANLSILANNLMSRDGLARVAAARPDLPRAIQIYRELLSHGPGQKWVSVFEPRYLLEIARFLERSGDKQAALKEYERFLDFWKRADVDLPELPEARRAVERLRLRR
jgi:tetratricopeptide (TPR) repeat protein/TolB-like protein